MLIAMMPVQVAALSCTPHSVEAAYLEAQADSARFVIVRGQLDFNGKKLPKAGLSNQGNTPEMTRIKARLTGTSLSGEGFVTPFNKRVTLALSCFGPWCANARAGVDVLVFVEQTAQGGVISSNPCGGYLFETPTPEMIRTVKQCFAGKACVPVR